MSQDQNKDRIALGDEIMETIKKGEVKMRPRWYFVLRDTLGVMAIILVLLIAVYIASFIIFVLHQDGAWFVPVFGLAGWYALFNALPWTLVLLSTAFIIILAILAKRYPLVYQWPLIYSILGIAFLVIGACFLFVRTSLYSILFNSSISRQIPVLGWYYPGVGFLDPGNVHRGTFLAPSEGGFIMENASAKAIFVAVASDTNIAPGLVFQRGDMLVIFGNQSPTGTIFAAGVEKLTE